SKIRSFSIPKRKWDLKNLQEYFGDQFEESHDAWLIPCKHRLNRPATRGESAKAEKALGVRFPASLCELLRQTDGAQRFIVSLPGLGSSARRRRQVYFKMFGASEIVEVNSRLWENFRSIFADDPTVNPTEPLNYVAFCDAGNANYQALHLEGQRRGKVFLLQH